MRTYKTEAIVLRRTNYGEADRIVSIITPECGKLSILAKGVRRQKSKLAGGLELLSICELTLIDGRGMSRLIGSRLETFFNNILSDYDRLKLAYYFIKKINNLSENLGEPELYNLLKDALGYLNDTSIDWCLISIWFDMQLLSLMGQGVNLQADIKSKKLKENGKYSFDFLENAFYENEYGKFTGAHIKFLRLSLLRSPAVMKNVGGAGVVIEDCLEFLSALDS